jgi:hypothetical protein
VFPGPGVVPTGGGDGLVIRRGSGGHYVNIVVANFPSDGISYRDATSVARESAGLLSFKGILVAQTPNRFDAGQQTYSGPADDVIHEPGTTAASLFMGYNPAPASMADIDLRPAAGATIRTGGFTNWAAIPDLATRGAGLDQTTYRGAFAPDGPNWMDGWTEYSPN